MTERSRRSGASRTTSRKSAKDSSAASASRTSTTSRSAMCSSATARSRWHAHSPRRRAHLRNTRRADRVAEAVRVEVATFLTESAKDPRVVGFVTVTAAEISPDLRPARVYVSVLVTESEKRATFDGLQSIASHLRSRVAQQLRLRV